MVVSARDGTRGAYRELGKPPAASYDHGEMRGRRRLVLAAAATVAAGSAAAAAPASFSAHQNTSVAHRLFPNAVSFVDRTHGVLGTGYLYSGHHDGGAIELTSDGGKTWHVVLRTPRAVVGLVPNGSYLYARFDDGETLESRDAGHTWRPSTTPPGPGSSVCPIGLYVGSNGGDPSWSLCNTQPGAGNQGKAVYRDFVDRGWKRVACTNFANSHFLCGKHSYGGISSLGYPSGIAGTARGGFGIIWESSGTIWTTRDGGKRWTGHPKLAEFSVDDGRWAGVLPRGGVGYVILTRGTDTARLVETTDFGRTWHVVRSWKTAFR